MPWKFWQRIVAWLLGQIAPGGSAAHHRLPIALIIAWAFERTPEGTKRTKPADVTRQHSRGGLWMAVVLVAAALSIGLFFIGRYTAINRAPRPASTELRRSLLQELAHQTRSARILSDKPSFFAELKWRRVYNIAVGAVVAHPDRRAGFSVFRGFRTEAFASSNVETVLGIDDSELPAVEELMKKYHDCPMDFTDATLVHLARRESLVTIFTVDHDDFEIYRIAGRRRFRVVPEREA
jgi:hypothetical protein